MIDWLLGPSRYRMSKAMNMVHKVSVQSQEVVLLVVVLVVVLEVEEVVVKEVLR